MTKLKTHHGGWKRSTEKLDVPVKYGDDVIIPTFLPQSVDLRPMMPPIDDQGNLGSCTANAGAGAFRYLIKKLGLPDFEPSRLKIYYDELTMDGVNPIVDVGSSLTTCCKVLSQIGVCNETEWPYVIQNFATKPSAQCYADGLHNKLLTFKKVSNVLTPSLIKLALSEGYPIIFGFDVFESFESQAVASTGIMPMPLPSEEIIGGHANVISGYDDTGKICPVDHAIVRNSWGTDWGEKGYYYMPYSFLCNTSWVSDLWILENVSEIPITNNSQTSTSEMTLQSH